MAAVDVITEYVDALPGDTRRVAHAEWGVTLDEERGGGWPLDVGMRLADGLLRVQAFALPYREDLDFGQVLHWNRQTRMARFACTRSGDIWVQADLPVEAVARSSSTGCSGWSSRGPQRARLCGGARCTGRSGRLAAQPVAVDAVVGPLGPQVDASAR